MATPSDQGVPCYTLSALPSGYARYSQGGTDQICCRGTEIWADHETGSVAIVRRLGTVASLGALDLVLFWIFCFIMAEALKTATRRWDCDACFGISANALALLADRECPKRR
jgi:hypothetical protein